MRQMIFPLIFFYYTLASFIIPLRSKLVTYWILGVFTVGILLYYPENKLIAIEWVIYALLAYLLSYIKTDNHLFSIIFTVTSTHFGAWIYEVANTNNYLIRDLFYNPLYPLGANSQILSGILMAYILIKKRIQIEHSIIKYYVLFLISALFLFYRINYSPFYLVDLTLYHRIPTMLLFLSLLTGIEGYRIQLSLFFKMVLAIGSYYLARLIDIITFSKLSEDEK